MERALLEREGELARIGARLRAARDGAGALIVVEGPAGMGKTEVLRAARESAEGLRALRARGSELERDFAFGVVRQLFEPALALATPEELADVVQGPAALAAGALGLPGGSGDGAGDLFAVLHGLYWLGANLAARTPLLLCVDDVHWADAPSLRFLAFLLARLEELPVAILAGARPDLDTALVATLVSDPAVEIVRLAPLSASAVGRIVGRDEPAFARACRDATGGVPLLVRALAGALREEEIASAEEVQQLGARTVGRWVQARLARLPEPAARLAKALAILETAELSPAAALAGVDGADPAVLADRLAAAGIIEASRPLAFVHPIVRAGVYGEIAPAEKAAAHRRAAELLCDAGASDQVLAEHLLVATPAGDDWVVERLCAAARASSRSGAPDTAAVLLRRALAEPPPEQDRPQVALELGLAELSAGEPGWRGHLELALDIAPDDDARLAAAMVLGHGLLRDQESPEAVRMLDRTAARVSDGARGVLEAAAIISGLVDARTAPLLEERLDTLRHAVAADPNATRDALALAAYASGLKAEPADGVAELARRALAAGARPFPAPTDGPWFAQVSVALLFAERYAELDTLLETAIAYARQTGDGALFGGAVAHRAWLALRRGDLSAAEGDTRIALEARDLPLPPLYRWLATAAMMDAMRDRGDYDAADRVAASAGTAAEGLTVTAGVLRAARGRLRLAQDRPHEALTDALAAGQVALATLSTSPSCVPWRADAALAHFALGETEAAERYAREAVVLARRVGAPRVLGLSLRALGMVTGDRSVTQEAVAVLERGDARLILAKAQVDLGGRERLRSALDTAHRLGAKPLADRAELELRKTGARPRRAELTGLAALTAGERRVAELAGQGLTNREIAQALFVTARTVEGHLTQVFRKLDVPSRQALTQAF